MFSQVSLANYLKGSEWRRSSRCSPLSFKASAGSFEHGSKKLVQEYLQNVDNCNCTGWCAKIS